MAVLLASHCVEYYGGNINSVLVCCVGALYLRGYFPPPSPLPLCQIDFDESASQNRFTVKPGVDPELDESEHCQSSDHQETLYSAVQCCVVLCCVVLCVLCGPVHE